MNEMTFIAPLQDRLKQNRVFMALQSVMPIPYVAMANAILQYVTLMLNRYANSNGVVPTVAIMTGESLLHLDRYRGELTDIDDIFKSIALDYNCRAPCKEEVTELLVSYYTDITLAITTSLEISNFIKQVCHLTIVKADADKILLKVIAYDTTSTHFH